MAPLRPLRVLDICCGHGIVQKAVLERYPGREIEYIGVDEGDAPTPVEDGRLHFSFKQVRLDFTDPRKFESQLRQILAGSKVDVIDWHLPFSGRHRRGPSLAIARRFGKKDATVPVYGPGLLKAAAGFLASGGRINHSFNRGTPFFSGDFGPVPSSRQQAAAAYNRNLALFSRQSKKAGLVLDAYGLSMTGGDSDWHSQSREKARQLSEFVRAHTIYPETAAHVVLLSKPGG